MPAVFIARSVTQQEWGESVGISKHLYKIGLAEGDGKQAAADAVNTLNEESYAGLSDWQLVGSKKLDFDDDEAVIAYFADRQKMIDPLYYPRLKGARGIFRVDVKGIEASRLIKRTMEGKSTKMPKLKPTDIGKHLLDRDA